MQVLWRKTPVIFYNVRRLLGHCNPFPFLFLCARKIPYFSNNATYLIPYTWTTVNHLHPRLYDIPLEPQTPLILICINLLVMQISLPLTVLSARKQLSKINPPVRATSWLDHTPYQPASQKTRKRNIDKNSMDIPIDTLRRQTAPAGNNLRTTNSTHLNLEDTCPHSTALTISALASEIIKAGCCVGCLYMQPDPLDILVLVQAKSRNRKRQGYHTGASGNVG